MEDFEQNQDFEYIKERMKERPVNKKRLIRRMVITASMAVVFGVLACFTFLVLEPVFSNFLYPEEEPQAVEIPEDTDEMLPEDMMIVEEESTAKPEETTNKDDEVLNDYKLLYQKIYELANKTMKSMVTVTGVSQDIDWFNNSYENKGQTSGLIVANTGRELLILADEKILDKAEDLHVTFSDGTTAVASVKQTDANTEQVVIAVPVNQIGKSTLNVIDVASLGNSKSTSLLATPVIALGRPYGNTKSVAYGMITSKGTVLNLIDCNYELLTTDIYGSEEANGILLNLNGEVIGIINQKYNKDEAKNLISAVGISELKRTIERMSNGKEMAYLGINGTDVTSEANTSLGVPLGAYVTGIVMDSPAMKAGIQSGDVITKINEQEILSFSQYAAAIAECRPEETITVTLMRQGPEEYREITLSIPLEKLK